jgi:imidazolonepropionase
MTLGCFAMSMTFEEALIAATINGAWSLDRAGEVGSLEPGKLADLVLVNGDAINLIRVGAPSIAAVIKRGQVVYRNSDAQLTASAKAPASLAEARRAKAEVPRNWNP